MQPDRLFCIDLDQPTLPGFRQFISAWLYRGDDVTLVVDPGPLSTIPRLLDALRHHGVTRLDYILLTHIHIDHAGGSGALLKAYPAARLICHAEGIRHMIAPDKLWQGSRQVLGPLAEAYGEIVPVPAESISFAEDIGPIRAFVTPGHAVHHCSYLFDDLLFAGEVAGVRGLVPDGIFMRPATPPRFLLPVALDSVERMLALQPVRMVFAHYGLADDAGRHLTIARDQLCLWVRGVALHCNLPASRREAAIVAWLRENDPVYRNVDQLPQDIRQREDYFLGNTLRGMIEYVEGVGEEGRLRLAAG